GRRGEGRDTPGNFRQRLGVWERQDPRKRYKEAQSESTLREPIAGCEAVNHSPDWSCLFENFFCIGVSIACMDDDRQVQFFRDGELVPEHFSLKVARRIVVKVIEACFTDGNDFRMLRILFHMRIVPLFDLFGIMRMDADAGVNPIVCISNWNPATHLIRTAAVSDREYGADAGVPCALQRQVAIAIETRIVEMCM